MIKAKIRKPKSRKKKQKFPQKILTKELGLVMMVVRNEKKFTRVIHDNTIKMWVGFGWINLRPATQEDRNRYYEAVDRLPKNKGRK